MVLFFFFFQAEDGIRDYKVTGVQTCALPICCGRNRGSGDSGPPPRSRAETRRPPHWSPAGRDAGRVSFVRRSGPRLPKCGVRNAECGTVEAGFGPAPPFRTPLGIPHFALPTPPLFFENTAR